MPTTYANSINNNPIYAERAEKDAAGNTISTTYATKSELPSGVPAVTSSDNNKTLVSTYNNGVGSYAWAQNTFVAVYGTSTYAEIKAAIDAGYNVLCLKTDSTYQDSSFAGGIGYIYRYGRTNGNIEFNYFQSFPNSNQATASNQGIAIVHIWKVAYNNTWTASTVVVAPKIVAASPLSLSYNNTDREVTLGVSLGNTLTTTNNAIEVAAPIPDVTSSDDGKVLKATYSGGVGSYAWETEGGGGTTYTTGSTASVVISTDDTVVVNSADVTSVTIGSAVNSCVVQWTVNSTTTLPTIVADTGNSYTYKAAGNNPTALTVGKTYQLSILRDCWVIGEFG